MAKGIFSGPNGRLTLSDLIVAALAGCCHKNRHVAYSLDLVLSVNGEGLRILNCLNIREFKTERLYN